LESLNLMNATRRNFLCAGLSAAALAATPTSSRADEPPGLPPVRTITRGPKHHWFAYYDKLQLDPSIRYCLGNAVDFEHRSPTAEDTIEVGMVDLQQSDRWVSLGT